MDQHELYMLHSRIECALIDGDSTALEEERFTIALALGEDHGAANVVLEGFYDAAGYALQGIRRRLQGNIADALISESACEQTLRIAEIGIERI